MPYVLFDQAKGFCNCKHQNLKKLRSQTEYTNGFDRLPWDEALGSDSEPESEEKEPTVQLKKAQRKEQKLHRKLSSAKNKILEKSLEKVEKVEKPDPKQYNPYVSKKQIKQLYLNILSLYKESGEFKLFQYHSIALYKTDLDFMLPGEWLNDNNISFVYELLNRLFIKENNFSFEVQLLVPSLIQLFLHFPVAEDLVSILPMSDLKKLKFIFIPFNFMDDDAAALENANNGDHWALCVFSLLNNTLYVYDSMTDDDDDDTPLKALVQRLQMCKPLLKSNAPIQIAHMKCDQQDNSDDCGVYLIMVTCVLIQRLFYSDKNDEYSDYTVDLDISNVKFNALSGRHFMVNLVYKLARQLIN